MQSRDPYGNNILLTIVTSQAPIWELPTFRSRSFQFKTKRFPLDLQDRAK
jgi:hypothetical protein